ncbi:MAG: hypothetical protein ACRD3Q_17795 [Terriglobales bacterium]
MNVVGDVHAIAIDGSDLSIGTNAGGPAAAQRDGASARAPCCAAVAADGVSTIPAHIAAAIAGSTISDLTTGSGSAAISTDVAAIAFTTVDALVPTTDLATIAGITGSTGVAAFAPSRGPRGPASLRTSRIATVFTTRTGRMTAAARTALTAPMSLPASRLPSAALALGFMLWGCQQRDRHQRQSQN